MTARRHLASWAATISKPPYLSTKPLLEDKADAGLLVEAGSTILGMTALAKLVNAPKGRVIYEKPIGPTRAAESEISAGTNVTRNFGGRSDIYGESWTTDPIPLQSRNSLGLETTNTGEFIAHGTVVDSAGITTREALEWGRFSGGGQETLIPNAGAMVQLRAVTMPDDPLPWSRPTDPRPLPVSPRKP